MSEKDKDSLRDKLTAEQFQVTQQCGTEPPFSGQYYHHEETGVYHCICCDAPLFASTTKFDSGSGWPSYFSPINETAVKEISDVSHGMVRTEVRCAACDAHLGHVFPDGPQPSGLRYCINSVSLDFSGDDSQV